MSGTMMTMTLRMSPKIRLVRSLYPCPYEGVERQFEDTVEGCKRTAFIVQSSCSEQKGVLMVEAVFVILLIWIVLRFVR